MSLRLNRLRGTAFEQNKGRLVVNILALQPSIVPYSRTVTTRSRVRKLLDLISTMVDAAPVKVDLVVLPELCTLDYSDDSFAVLADLAEPEQGLTFRKFSMLAKQLGVAISFSTVIQEGGRYFISNIVIARDGRLLSRYDKVHLAQLGASHEGDYFTEGLRFGAFEMNGFRFGVMLCYDFRFPNYVHALCEKHGLDVLLHPVAFTHDETFATWHHFAITRAIENQVYFLSINRAGELWGRSILCPPWVDESSPPAILGIGESSHIVSLDKEFLQGVRHRFPIQRNTKDSYQSLDEALPTD